MTYAICKLDTYDPGNVNNKDIQNSNAPFGGLFSAFSNRTVDELEDLKLGAPSSVDPIPWGPAYLVIKTSVLTSNGSNSSTFIANGT